MVWDYQMCDTTVVALSITFTIIACLLCLTVIYTFYKLLSNLKHETMTKLGQQCGIVFSITTLLAMVLNVIQCCGKCLFGITYSYYQVLFVLYNLTFAISTLLLLIIFFVRIKNVFHKTPFKLSQKSSIAYYSIFMVIIILTMVTIALYIICTDVCRRISTFLASMVLLLIVIVMISMVILFINRLIKVYKSDNDNGLLIAAITRITILCTISVSMTVIDSITTSLYRNVTNYIYIQWIFNYIALFDLYTNFICVILCYKSFKGIYENICSCCDKLCRVCWMKIIDKRTGKEIDENVIAMNNHIKDQENTIASPESI